MLSEGELSRQAKIIRQDILIMLNAAGSGHSGGPLGMADIFTCLYFSGLYNFTTKLPCQNEDVFVLSAGHLCPVLYCCLAETGLIKKSEMLNLRKFEAVFQGHPHNLETIGIMNSSGPLGQGLSQAIGMALAKKHDGYSGQIIVVLSDGEHDEGQVWEAIMLAGKLKLDNLTVIVDRNYIQLSGPTEEILPIGALAEKYRTFGWQTKEIDGHNIDLILESLRWSKEACFGPKVIIAKTILGKGVSFMENDYHWHGKTPNNDQLEQALNELRI